MPGADSTRQTVRSRRLIAGAAVLAAVWVAVYWATPPANQPAAAITFDSPADTSLPAPPTRTADAPPADPQGAEPTQVVVAAPPPEPPASSPTDAQPAVIPPAFREHVVRSGETMETIARAELGDSSLWTVVASANPRVDPLRLRPGMKLRIPLDPDNIQGKPNPALAQAPQKKPEAPSAEPARIEYVVRSGDTLGGIARTYYNSAAKWRVILDANRGVISRPEDLRPGMKLVIPPAPTD